MYRVCRFIVSADVLWDYRRGESQLAFSGSPRRARSCRPLPGRAGLAEVGVTHAGVAPVLCSLAELGDCPGLPVTFGLLR